MKNRKIRFTQKELPPTEQPYEKAEQNGITSLTDGELLAVIIRTGSRGSRALDVAHAVLARHEQYPGLVGLNYLTLEELKSIDGIGRVKAIQLSAVAELSKRMAAAVRPEGICFQSPEQIAGYYMESMRFLTREELLVGMLDSRNRLTKDMKLSAGTVNFSVVSPREVFLCAFKHEAVSIFLVHNHPSGDPAPSKEDIMVTRRLSEIGSLIGIKLVDHIIIGDNRYISLKEQGIL
ncbi:RadC family protein [Anaerolentibacter hominis]|uniref:RadC family protein n=1 Tax=Anaerolentibacter hominis TaxID=3079009 RepID=UPI0031B88E14